MPSTTRNSVRLRCSQGKQGCAQYFRMSLKRYREAQEYKCPHCGCGKVYHIESWRRKGMSKQDKCHCHPIPFPHKKGSLRFCLHHELCIAGIEPTEDEHRDYEAMLETPRSAFR